MSPILLSGLPELKLFMLIFLNIFMKNGQKKSCKRPEEVIKYINDNPSLYVYSKKGDAYKCVVVKQVSLFYSVKNNYIELLVFWDNRQNPARLLL